MGDSDFEEGGEPTCCSKFIRTSSSSSRIYKHIVFEHIDEYDNTQ